MGREGKRGRAKDGEPDLFLAIAKRLE